MSKLVFTQSDLDALKAALLAGTTKVSIGERSIEYKSTDDLIKTIKLVESYLSSSEEVVNTNIPASFSKGQK